MRRHQPSQIWVSLYTSIGLAWVLLFVMSSRHTQIPKWGVFDGAMVLWLANLCAARPSVATTGVTAAMWILMVVAMMLPTAIPALRTYRDIEWTARDASVGGVGYVAFGYLAVWIGFAIAASGLQLGLAESGVLSQQGVLTAPMLAAGLLVLAGLFQLSKYKERAVSRCRHPMMFFLAKWRCGRGGAVKLGVLYGLLCLSCCWALMLLAFVAGTMNLVFMGVATVLMIFEKLSSTSEVSRNLVGVALLLAGGVIIGQNL